MKSISRIQKYLTVATIAAVMGFGMLFISPAQPVHAQSLSQSALQEMINTLLAQIAALQEKVQNNGSAPSTSVTPGTNITIGETVRVVDGPLSIRANPGGILRGVAQSNQSAVVVGGPQMIDGYVWWQLDYRTGADGWSAADWLVVTTAANTGENNEVNPQPEGEVAGVIGMTTENAAAYIENLLGASMFRVSSIDGQPQPVTMDYRPGRINANVVNGVVVGYRVEGGSLPEPPNEENEPSPQNWTRFDVQSITVRPIADAPRTWNFAPAEYAIVLNNGRQIEIRLLEAGSRYKADQFMATGFTGDINALQRMAVAETSNEEDETPTNINKKPDTPSVSGPDQLEVGEIGRFEVRATDTNDRVTFEIDQNSDGVIDDRTALTDSGSRRVLQLRWLEEGRYTMSVWAVDESGLRSNVRTVGVVVADANDPIDTNTWTIDDVSSITVSPIGRATWNFAPSEYVVTLNDGTQYTITSTSVSGREANFRAVGYVGDINELTRMSVVVEDTPTNINKKPDTPSVSGPDQLEVGEIGRFEVRATDTNDRVTFEIDQNSDGVIDDRTALTDSGSRRVLQLRWLEEGRYTMSVWAVDESGLRSNVRTVGVVVADATPIAAPTVTLRAGVVGGQESTFDLTLQDGQSVYLRMASTNASSCSVTEGARYGFAMERTSGTDTSIVEPPAGSSYDFTVRCVNSAGVSATDSITVSRPIVEPVGPSMPDTLRAPSGLVASCNSNNQAVLNWNRVDGASGYQVRINDDNNLVFYSPDTIETLPTQTGVVYSARVRSVEQGTNDNSNPWSYSINFSCSSNGQVLGVSTENSAQTQMMEVLLMIEKMLSAME